MLQYQVTNTSAWTKGKSRLYVDCSCFVGHSKEGFIALAVNNKDDKEITY